MKTTRHRIYTLGFALALATSSLHATTSTLPAPKPEFLNSEQLADWRAKKTAEFEAKQAQEVQMRSVKADVFYTGKPYLEETETYAFRFRSYNPEFSRWTSADPSGFPDGANNFAYVGNTATNSFDPLGLQIYTFAYTYHAYYQETGPNGWSLTISTAANISSIASSGMTSTVLGALSGPISSFSGSTSGWSLVSSSVSQGWLGDAPASQLQYIGFSFQAITPMRDASAVYYPTADTSGEDFFDPWRHPVLGEVLGNGHTPSPQEWAEHAPEGMAYPGTVESYQLTYRYVGFGVTINLELE